jgi:hypothetical protein
LRSAWVKSPKSRCSLDPTPSIAPPRTRTHAAHRFTTLDLRRVYHLSVQNGSQRFVWVGSWTSNPAQIGPVRLGRGCA